MAILTGLKAITFFVDDPQAVGLWYQSLFDILPIRSSKNLMLFRKADLEFALHLRDFEGGSTESIAVPYFSVSNLDQAIASVVELGATPRRYPMLSEEGSRIAQVVDPFGNTIGLIEAS